jgi:hypothetical protein
MKKVIFFCLFVPPIPLTELPPQIVNFRRLFLESGVGLEELSSDYSSYLKAILTHRKKYEEKLIEYTRLKNGL